VSFYSNNRLDIEEALRTFQYVLRFFLIAGLFWGGGATLRYVGYADLVVALYLFVSRVYFWKRLSPELAIRASSVDLDRLWPILRMSVWVLVNYLGVVLFLRTNIWVANKFISEAAGGEYGALLLIDRLIRSGTTIVTFVISPMIMIYYSKGELARANKVAQLAEKLMMGLVAVICALICAYSPHLLSLWLGAEFVYLWPVVVALVSHLFLNSGCSSLFHLHNAYNKVKAPAIVTVVLGLINAVMGIYLTSMHGMGLLGVAIVTSVLLTVKNVVFIPAFTSIVTNESVGYYLKPMMSGFGVFFCVASVSMLSYVVGVESNLVFQAALGIFAAVVGLFVFFRVFLSSSEFNLLLEILPKRARAVVLCFPLRKN
ncbi:MAG: lipopolysaccharide biosynthesis protein, partial [Paracoccaceae bacterium]